MFANGNGFSTLSKIAKGIIVLLTIFYGIVFSYFTEFVKEKGGVDILFIFYLINVLNASFILLKGFFPQFLPFYDIFLRPYPVKLIIKSFGILIYHFVSLFNILPIIFCITLFTLIKDYNFLQFLLALVVIITFYIIERVIKLTLGTQHLNLVVIISLPVLYFIGYYSLIGNEFNTFLLSIIFLLTCIILFIKSYKTFCNNNRNIDLIYNKKQSILSKNNVWNKIRGKKPLFNTIIIAILFKLTIILVTGLSVILKGTTNLINEKIIIALICSPVVLFNYAFNNLFGYKPQVFLHIGFTSEYQKWLFYYLNTIRKVIVIDFLISLVVLFSVNPVFFNFIYLVILYITTIIFGFLSSVLFPRKVKDTINFSNFKSNTSPLVSFFLILFTIAMYVLSHKYVYFIAFVSLIYVLILIIYFKFLQHQFFRNFLNTIEKII